jgi:hypothetical protein
MVYWADLLYAEPVAEARLEAAETQLIEEELPEIGLRWVVEAEDEEAAFIGQLADRIGFEELASNDPVLLPPAEPTPRSSRRPSHSASRSCRSRGPSSGCR